MRENERDRNGLKEKRGKEELMPLRREFLQQDEALSQMIELVLKPSKLNECQVRTCWLLSIDKLESHVGLFDQVCPFGKVA